MKTIYTGLLTAIGIIGLSSLSWGQCFEPTVNYKVDNSPQSIATGDFNGDNKPDLVTANLAASTISVLLNNGNGGFNILTSFAVGRNPQSIAVSDFDGDGKLDLVTANNSDNTVSVMLNKGGGSFSAAVNLNVDAAPNSVTVGDFNADGKPDIATANTYNSVSILLNKGGGAFTPVANVTTNGDLFSIVVGDVNSDNKLDLITTDFVFNRIATLLGNGDGSFHTATYSNTGSSPTFTAVSDFNADGRLDVATAISNLGPNNFITNSVGVQFGNGDGTFGPSYYSYSVDSSPYSVAVADFNADGKPDLVTSNYKNSTVSVLLNEGDGVFDKAMNFSVGTYPTSIAIADFNTDSKPDLATANKSANTISILLNCTSASATTTSLTLTVPAYNCITGLLSLSTTGGNGQPVEYRVAGLHDWASSNTFAVPTYQRNGTTFTLQARQSGTTTSLPFTATCQTTPTPPTLPANLTITAFTCHTTNNQLSSVDFVVGYTNGTFAPALPDLFINGVTNAGKLGQPYSLSFDANQSTDAIQDQATRATYFVWNYRQACANQVPAALSLTAPTFNCSTGQLTLTTIGGSGQPIDYRVLGLGNWSVSNTFSVPTYQRSGTTFALEARQSGQAVSLPFVAACPVSARMASAEAESKLSVVVYPNPVVEQFSVGVSGAAGQAVRFELTNLSGQTVVDQRATVVNDAHTGTLSLPASGAGLYLLRVSTTTQSQTVKVLRP